MSKEQIIKLLDYITNLQEENKRLKRDYATMTHDNCYVLELEQKIDKALDAVHKLKQSVQSFGDEGPCWLDDFERILNGDKE